MRLFPSVLTVYGKECPVCGCRESVWDEEKAVAGLNVRVVSRGCECNRKVEVYLDGEKIYER